MSQIVLYFLHSTSVVSFYIDVVLTLSMIMIIICLLRINPGLRHTHDRTSVPTLNHKTHALIFNTLRPRRNEQNFADDNFKRIFFNENVWISILISVKFVPKGPINNIPALVQIMAWRRSGDTPLSEPMMVCLPTHICVTRPQWVKMRIGRYIKYRNITPHANMNVWNLPIDPNSQWNISYCFSVLLPCFFCR